MPRSTYYQSAGNPLQVARLPNSRPQLAFRHPLVAPGIRLQWIALKAILAQVTLIATFLLGPSQAIQEHPVLCGLLLIGMGLCAARLFTWSDWGYALFGTVAGTVWLVSLFQTPLVLWSGLSVSLWGLLSYQFAKHWTEICLASPLEREFATERRQEWAPAILGSAFAPLFTALLARLTGNPLLAAILLTTFVGVQLLTACYDTPLASIRTLWQAVDSWCNYNPNEVYAPGLLPSPAGSSLARFCLSLVTVATISLTCKMWILSARLPLSTSIDGGGPLSAWDLLLANAVLLVVAFLVPVSLVAPILTEADRWRQAPTPSQTWTRVVKEMRNSEDQIERSSYYLGRVAADRSPLLVPRQIFGEHAHFAGDAGSGKTSMGLAPWIEQTVMFGDCSLVIIDMKGDTLELLATASAAAERHFEMTGRRIPVKHFTNRSDLPTHAFNPMLQPYWQNFDLYDKADIFCGAAGLIYGADYGAGWYSEANGAVAYDTFKNKPSLASFVELAEQMEQTISSRNKELHAELKSAGVHVSAVANRLASCEALCVTPNSGISTDILEEAIDLSSVFESPQIVHFHLPSTTSPGTAPMIARLAVYVLLCAASQVRRNCPVYLVIDEFQRMAAHNMEYVLQLARSMGVGVILANQSLQDLGDLVPAVEANCRYRQWFSVSSLDDLERLVRQGGETVEWTRTESSSAQQQTISLSETILPRLSANDLLLASDHPMRSIVKVSRGAGYAQYGGFPFVVESGFHIDRDEYERRKAFAWPALCRGTFIPRDHRVSQTQRPTRTPPIDVPTEVLRNFRIEQTPKRSGTGRDRKRPSKGDTP